MTQYRTYLVNFGFSKYYGPKLDVAKAAAVKSGFESVIYADSQPILSWSPIQGWRGMVTQS
jgi:hypothetical protein